MSKEATNKFEISILRHPLTSMLDDDIEMQILSPLSCLREFNTHWLLEFDLPLVNKKDIKVTFDVDTISVEAKLKEMYSEEKLGDKLEFQYFKKTITMPRNTDKNKTMAKFQNGILRIIIPKRLSGRKIKIQ